MLMRSCSISKGRNMDDINEKTAEQNDAAARPAAGTNGKSGTDEKAGPNGTEKETVSRRSFIIALIIVIAFGVALNLCIGSVKVKETSMLPNFVENDHLFINKIAYKTGEPKRGDVIIFHKTVYGTSEDLIKRVVALPGETVNVRDGQLYVNGKKQDQSFTYEGTTSGSVKDFKVPAGRLYVMGDNRTVSIDSRDPDVGTVAISKVKGKVFFRLLPFSKFGRVPTMGTD